MRLGQPSAHEFAHDPQDGLLEEVIRSVGTGVPDRIEDPCDITIVTVQISQDGSADGVEEHPRLRGDQQSPQR